MKPDVFIKKITVQPQAIDDLDHVNNLIYLQWCLDAAKAHWISKTTPEQRQKYVWVVLKHTITYKSPAFLGEELTLKTWVQKCEGVKSFRNYQISNAKTNKLLVEAQTIWCLLHTKSKKPTKITEEIRNLFN